MKKLLRKIFSAKFEKFTGRRTDFMTCKLNETSVGCDVMKTFEDETSVVVGVFNPVAERKSIVEIKAPHSRIQGIPIVHKFILNHTC